jgi:hypothetical protein
METGQGTTTTGAYLDITVESSLGGHSPYTSSDIINLKGILHVDPDDIGKPGEIYLVGFFNSVPKQRDSSGDWVVWDTTLEGLISAADSQKLPSSFSFSLLENFTRQPGNYEFVVGYKEITTDKIIYNHRPVVISVNPFSPSTLAIDLKQSTLKNQAAYIPSQCYTKTKDEDGVTVHNPCYACHRRSQEPNYIDDDELQLSFDFAESARTNMWTNLFKDRTGDVGSITDEDMLKYVRNDNYSDGDGEPTLAKRLNNLSAEWDLYGDGKWDGYVPDCYFNFDSQGFDRTAKSGYTGWRAFAYYPFLGTFWPTNGSTDDVFIRLGEPFRNNEFGQFDIEVYKINMAIVEAVIKRKDVDIDPVDENIYQVDLDKDGKLGTAKKITYDWAPLEGKYM